MRILVLVKRVIDYEARKQICPQTKTVVTEGVRWIVNPFDEIAVEEALRIKESRALVEDVEIVVVSIGPREAVEQLRSMLALGADRAVLIRSDVELDSFAVSQLVARICEEELPQLILLGKQAIDSDAGQTGQLLSASLGCPLATCASRIVIDQDFQFAEVTSEVDGGLEACRLSLPAVVSADLRLNEPRYATIKGVMNARRKTVREIDAQELVPELQVRTKVIAMELAPRRPRGIRVRTVDELLDKLYSQSKLNWLD